MQIIDQRYLDSANRYSTEPCLLSILDLGEATPACPATMEELRERLAKVLPGLRRGRSLIGIVGDEAVPEEPDSPCQGIQLARLIQSVAIELHRLTGDEVMVGFVGRVPKMHDRYRLILPFRCGTVANAALSLAIALIDALLRDEGFDLEAGLAELRTIAAANQPDPGPTPQPSIRIAA